MVLDGQKSWTDGRKERQTEWTTHRGTEDNKNANIVLNLISTHGLFTERILHECSCFIEFFKLVAKKR